VNPDQNPDLSPISSPRTPEPSEDGSSPSLKEGVIKESVILSEAQSAESKDPHLLQDAPSSTDPNPPQIEPEEPPAPPLHHAPPKAPAFFRWLTYLLLIPLIAASTAFFGSLSLLCGLWDKSGRQQHFIAHLWARSLLLFSLSPVTLIGEEKLRVHQTAVYTSNHLSYYDTPVLFARLPFQFRIFAKQGLWKIPFIGWYLNRSGQVPVDHSSARSAVVSLNRGVQTLKQGLPLVIFPEGGRTPNGYPKTFVSGAAYMAIKAQVPVVPITLIGTYELLPMHVYHLNPRPLAIVIGDPIPTIGLTSRDADALTRRLVEIITATYLEFHPELRKQQR
jgi:1-acyl-sn-glycerol-3-phosphate acyltransferase